MFAGNFNPGARNFNPNGSSINSQGSSASRQVSAPPSPYLEARILSLESTYTDLRDDVNALTDLYHDMCQSFGKAQPCSQDVDLVKSRQSAMQFMEELEQLSHDVQESVNGNADERKVNGGSTPMADNNKVPLHKQAASVTSRESGGKSLPPHLRGKQLIPTNGVSIPRLSLDVTKDKHEPLVTDGPIDTLIRQPTVPAAAPSPPPSPSTTVKVSHIEAETLSNDWKPHYLTTLAALPAEIAVKIPAKQDMATFSFDMLQNVLSGIAWSPGMRFINTSRAPLLKNRTYYLLDPTYEPYLPRGPGEHGAKLTAFFNTAPDEEFDDLPEEGIDPYTDVPMFVQVLPGRYAYFGNYSQTRWSDKLDNDTMRSRVPQRVLEHISKDLTALPREEWLTNELKKHFFPRPEYEGAVLPLTGTSVVTTDVEQHSRQVESDVKKYVQELAGWEREASMKTSMMKSDFILKAFDSADADYPPALRLWWEYFECVNWKADFYNMLVGLQARADDAK